MGLGAYGKNGILQTATYGSYVALRNVLTDAELLPDTFVPASAHLCEGCERCLKACPMGALYAPYKVNPTLCINPISRREAFIEPHIRLKMQNWISGCDICEEVCPANRHLQPCRVDPRAGFDSHHHTSHKNLDGLEREPELIPLLEADQPMVIRRNAAISLANIAKGRKEAVIAIRKQLDTASVGLREYFTWALNELE
jgi:epoxyqueuosine reductase